MAAHFSSSHFARPVSPVSPASLPVPAEHQPVAAAAGVVRGRGGRFDPAFCSTHVDEGKPDLASTGDLAGLHPHRRPDPERRVGRQADVESDAAAAAARRGFFRTGHGAQGCYRASIRDVVGVDPVLVHVYRPDVVSQAVSFWRAVQTRVWRGRPDPARDARAELSRRCHRARHHDAAGPGGGLAKLVRRGERRTDRGALIPCCGATSPRSSAPSSTHSDSTPGSAPHPVLERQADGRSDEWVDRYRADAQREGLPT